MSGEIAAGDWRVNHDLVAEFDLSFAQAETYRRVGVRLLEKSQPDFFAIYFQGVDVVSHYFWEFMRPLHAGRDVAPAEVAAWGNTVRAFYEYQDRILGELLALIDKDTIVFVVSDHGFQDFPVSERHVKQISGWHRLDGIFIVSGPGVRPGARVEGASVYDVAPTVLALAGRPLARDMRGSVLAAAFQAGVLPPTGFVAAYTEMPEAPEISSEAVRSPIEREMLRRLQSIGYIDEAGKAKADAD